jgi:hypothetical protein
MTKKFSIYLALVSLLFCSCRSMHTVEGEYRFEQNPGKGLVVISTRIDSNCGVIKGGTIEFQAISSGEKSLFLLDNPFIGNDFTNPPGYFWVRSLPAGDYRLARVTIAQTASVNPLNMVFSVREGKAVYLGEFNIRVPDCKGFTYRIKDEWERDARLLSERIKNLRAEDLQKDLLVPSPLRTTKAERPAPVLPNASSVPSAAISSARIGAARP